MKFDVNSAIWEKLFEKGEKIRHFVELTANAQNLNVIHYVADADHAKPL